MLFLGSKKYEFDNLLNEEIKSSQKDILGLFMKGKIRFVMEGYLSVEVIT